MKVINSLIGISVLFLTGCTGITSDFECPIGHGVNCKRIDEINSSYESGILGINHPNRNNQLKEEKNIKGTYGNFSTPYPFKIKAGDPFRYDPTVMRIWVAPYEDKTGNYHEQGYIYTVVDSGRWIGQPIKSTSKD